MNSPRLIAIPHGNTFKYPRLSTEVTNKTADTPIGIAATPVMEVEYKFERHVYALYIRADTLEEVGNEHSKDFIKEMRNDLSADNHMSPAQWAQRLHMWLRILERGGLRK